jgi:hypothetical protein
MSNFLAHNVFSSSVFFSSLYNGFVFQKIYTVFVIQASHFVLFFRFIDSQTLKLYVLNNFIYLKVFYGFRQLLVAIFPHSALDKLKIPDCKTCVV